MGKWSAYGKKFCAEWEKETGLKEWIRRVSGDEKNAFCRFCRCEMRAHHGDLVAHSKTEKHRKNATPFSNTRTLFDAGVSSVKVDTSVKVAELKLAAHIVCHSSGHTVDHLGEIIRDVSGKNIQLHRTKCAALIRRVLGRAMQLGRASEGHR